MTPKELDAFEALLQVLGDHHNRFKIAVSLGETHGNLFQMADEVGMPFHYLEVETVKPLLIENFRDGLLLFRNLAIQHNTDPDLAPWDAPEMVDVLLDYGLESLFRGRVSLEALELAQEPNAYTAASKILAWSLVDAPSAFFPSVDGE